ncbi:transcriptional regulator swi6 [Tieghemiomyces parasiticus]|uniref:Transcriptional regulator swi6 n=1 Tax=Tieghemiomyces parasiticus TaxID=78921 RepID=A0A9W7ZYQ9_9FUNG|nr:transcriptional regulator swi6 [Tieghemiomyces parasiticus]
MAATVVLAVYSGVSVYECSINAVAVMRRKSDRFLNATQILKVAAVPKPKRLRIIESELPMHLCEKIQGGYGKYQGTWVPFEVGVELARRFNVYEILRPIIDHNPTNNGTTLDETPTKEKASALRQKRAVATRVKKARQDSIDYDPRSSIPTRFSNSTSIKRKPSTGGGPMPASSPIVKRHRNATDDNVYPTNGMPFPPHHPIGAAGLVGHLHHPQLLQHPNGLHPHGIHPTGHPIAQSSPTPSPMDTFYNNASYNPSINSSPVFGVPLVSNGFVPPMALSTPGPLGNAGPASPDPTLPYGGPGSDATPFAEVAAATAATTAITGPTNPTNLKLASPTLTGVERQRALLMALFLNDDLEDLPAALPPGGPSDLDFDLVIDDQGHTPLHWAAALARNSLLEWLIERGADCLKRNHSGQTPLIRALLATEHYDRRSFPDLLVILHDAIPLVDNRSRSVVHHIVQLAGDRRKADAAHYYLECLLEWISQGTTATSRATSAETGVTSDAVTPPPEQVSIATAADTAGLTTNSSSLSSLSAPEPVGTESPDFVNFINLPDANGDTALNLAARLGDTTLIALLVSVGASLDIPNHAGLRPMDFPAVTEVLQAAGRPSEATSGPSALARLTRRLATASSSSTRQGSSAMPAGGAAAAPRSQRIATLVQQVVDDLEDDFQAELHDKQTAITQLQQQLQAATDELAATRATVTTLQARAGERTDVQAQIDRLESIIGSAASAEALAAATAASPFLANLATTTTPMDVNFSEPPFMPSDFDSFSLLGQSTPSSGTTVTAGTPGTSSLRKVGTDGPTGASMQSAAATTTQLVRLRSQTEAYQMVNQLLRQQIEEVQTQAAHREAQIKKVIALCCNIPLEKVDEWVQQLVVAMEPADPNDAASGGDTGGRADAPDSGAILSPTLGMRPPPTSLPTGGHEGMAAAAAAAGSGALNSGDVVDLILSPSMSEEQNIQRLTEFMNSVKRPKKSTTSVPTANPAPGTSTSAVVSAT